MLKFNLDFRGFPEPAPLAERFAILRDEWKRGRGNTSSTSKIVAHPAYREIVSMGWDVVPYIMAELDREPDFWFAALREITHADPVPVQSIGKLREMTKAWLQWGLTKNVRW